MKRSAAGEHSVGFIGAGNMAFALAAAIRRREPQTELHAFDIRPERIALFRERIPGLRPEEGNRRVVERSGVTFLAVKPQDIGGVLAEIGEAEGVVVSIAAGVPLRRLEAALARARVFRVMPNTPALVGEMAAAFAAGSRARPEDEKRVEALLSAAGTALPLPEELLDAVTALSGSGPAFVARLIEAWIETGTALGLPVEAARALTLQTFRGTAALLREAGLSPQQLVDMVSSPKGTTVAGREVLEASDLKEVIRRTLQAAAGRSKELGA
jgi:pyrroline-5-carboxylate reductase